VPASGPDAVATMVTKVEQWSRWYDILNLSREGAGPKVSFKLVRGGSQATPSDGDTIRMIAGESFELHAQTFSQQKLYFNLLDLSSDGSIKLVYPLNEQTAILEPGQ